ncbi:MAG: type IV secretion system protein [Vulcanimicrobiaceae bacterium]
MQSSVAGITGGWMDNALTYAAWLFSIVGVTSCIGTGVRHYSLKHTFEGIADPVAEMLFRLITPLVMLYVAQHYLSRIFDFASTLAGGITHVAIAGPDDILTVGMTSAGVLYRSVVVGPLGTYMAANPLSIAGSVAGAVGSPATTAASSLFGATPDFISAIALCLVGAGAFFMTLIAFTLIAAEMLVRAIDVFIKTSIGAVQIGWSASPATADMASAYWSAVLASVFQVVIIYAVASFLSTAALTAFSMPPEGTSDLKTMLRAAENAMLFSLAAVWIAVKVPHLAANAFNGRASLMANEAMLQAHRSATSAVKSLAPLTRVRRA